jgi:hypothetical protein
MLKRIIQFVLAIMLLPTITMAQSTTSGLSGSVKTNTGEVLVGATVIATHEPTGTVYKVQSRTGGRFDINNMNPGGPYSVEVSFTGFANEKKIDIYLSLGENFKVDFALASKATNIGGVTVTAVKKTTELSGKGGTETTISAEKMANLPSVGRNIYDYLRAVPQAKIGAQEGAVTIAGQNNRYNSFYIDGAVNNDVFGLSNSGTNGGQSSIAPISIDAIDQFQVVVSPYDASIGNFTGGGINAVTRGGTNKTSASVYYLLRNQDLTGKTPNGDKANATKLADFKNQTYGIRVGGAFIPGKLFYFVNYEQQKDVRPQPYTFAYTGTTNTIAGINALADTLRKRYNYEPGGFLSNDETVEAKRLTTRIDWNINDKHKLSASYRLTDGTRDNVTASSNTTINFFNNGYKFPTKTHSASLELKSVVGKSGSNKLLVTYNNVRDDRDPIGSPFPRVRITDGAGAIVFGPDNSSTQNLLTQKIYNILDNYKVTLGKHALTIGGEWEMYDAYNAFIQNTFGNYTYGSLSAFYNNTTVSPTAYTVGYPLIDNVLTDATAAAAKFKVGRGAGFISDELRVNDNLTLVFGVRADYTKFLTTPATDAFTNDIAIPKFAQYYNLEGARSGQTPKIPVSISPRLGFTYKIPDENLVIRGGLGMFTGRIPLVWPGGVYNNNGINQGGFSANATALSTIKFRSNPYGQWRANEVGISLSKGPLNLISEEFKLPKLFRASLAADKKFGNGWSGTIEGLFSKNINEIYYTNINLLPPTAVSLGPGPRAVYGVNGSTAAFIPITGTTNPYDNAILITNNSKKRGFAYNFTLTVDKKTRTNFNFNFNYAFGNSIVLNEATSSVNLSQWRFIESVNGRNGLERNISDFSQGHRIFAYMSKKFTYLDKRMATTISLVYTGQSGNPISYTYSSGSMVRDDGTAGTNDLMYIPTTTELQSMTFLSNTTGTYNTPQQQKDGLETYIQSNSYLKNRRGQFAERNGDRAPWTNIIDLKIAQDFNIRIGKDRYQLQLTYDMFNLTNFVNRDWGHNYFNSNDQVPLMQFAGYVSATNLTPQYRFNSTTAASSKSGLSTSTVPAYASRWTSVIGVRINFN